MDKLVDRLIRERDEARREAERCRDLHTLAGNSDQPWDLFPWERDTPADPVTPSRIADSAQAKGDDRGNAPVTRAEFDWLRRKVDSILTTPTKATAGWDEFSALRDLVLALAEPYTEYLAPWSPLTDRLRALAARVRGDK